MGSRAPLEIPANENAFKTRAERKPEKLVLSSADR